MNAYIYILHFFVFSSKNFKNLILKIDLIDLSLNIFFLSTSDDFLNIQKWDGFKGFSAYLPFVLNCWP